MRRAPRPLYEEGLRLIITATDIHSMILACQHGARGFCAMNAEKELTQLIADAKKLRKRVNNLKPEGFKQSFRKDTLAKIGEPGQKERI